MAEQSHEHMWERVGEGLHGTIVQCSRCPATEIWPAPQSTNEAAAAIDEEDD